MSDSVNRREFLGIAATGSAAAGGTTGGRLRGSG